MEDRFLIDGAKFKALWQEIFDDPANSSKTPKAVMMEFCSRIDECAFENVVYDDDGDLY